MKSDNCTAPLLDRRTFLAGLLAWLPPALTAAGPAAAPQNDIHILKPNDIERLRLDFNASRSKVRLVALLAPT